MPARETKIDQRVQANIGDREYMATATTIAPIGPTEFLVLLVAKRHAARTTVTPGNVNSGFVDKFHERMEGAGRKNTSIWLQVRTPNDIKRDTGTKDIQSG